MNTIWTARAKYDDSKDAPGSDAINENDMMNDRKEDETANNTNLSNDSDPLYGNSPSQPRPKPRFLIHIRGLPLSQSLLQPLSQPPSWRVNTPQASLCLLQMNVSYESASQKNLKRGRIVDNLQKDHRAKSRKSY